MNLTGKVMAVCISQQRGTQKQSVKRANIIEGWGIEGDAHGGGWHRQISLLSYEKIADFKKLGAKVQDGGFGENIIVLGINLAALPVGTRLEVNDALLEVTQIGKECHQHCAIYQQVGDCIMPREGIFAKVIGCGSVGQGDVVKVVDSQLLQNVL